MNAYQLWKMTANPIDPEKRSRIKKFMSKRGKKYVARPPSYRRTRTGMILEEIPSSSSKSSTHSHVKKRHHPDHLKTTDTILLQDARYDPKLLPQPHVLPNKSKSHIIHNHIGYNDNQLNNASTDEEKLKFRPAKKMNPNMSKRTNTILEKRPFTAPSVDSTSKYPRHRSPRRNRDAKAKWLIQHDLSGELKEFGPASPRTQRRRNNYHSGSIRRAKDQQISQPLFVPKELPFRPRFRMAPKDQANVTRLRIFNF